MIQHRLILKNNNPKFLELKEALEIIIQQICFYTQHKTFKQCCFCISLRNIEHPQTQEYLTQEIYTCVPQYQKDSCS